MVNPNEMSEAAVRTHAMSVRSCANRVRSTASRVLESSGDGGPPGGMSVTSGAPAASGSRRLTTLLDGVNALGAVLAEHLVGQIVLVDIGNVLDRFTANRLRSDDLDVVEPLVGVEAPVARAAPQVADAAGTGIV